MTNSLIIHLTIKTEMPVVHSNMRFTYAPASKVGSGLRRTQLK